MCEDNYAGGWEDAEVEFKEMIEKPLRAENERLRAAAMPIRPENKARYPKGLARDLEARELIRKTRPPLTKVSEGVSGNMYPQGPTFHWRDGWNFCRGEGLDVHIWNTERRIDLVIPRVEWDSIVTALK